MNSNPPVLIRRSLIVGMKSYQNIKFEKGSMKDLLMSHSDANRVKDYL